MQIKAIKPHHKQAILRTVPTFLVAYFISLFFWIQVKDYYGFSVTYFTSWIVGIIKDIRVDEIARNGDVIQVAFSAPFSIRPDMVVDIPVRTSNYTFNAPLTFGIMASMYFILQRKIRACAEGLLLLITVHLLYVTSLELKTLTETFLQMDIEPVSQSRLFLLQFLWSFTNNMVIRFEPFLIGFYLFIRFRKQ